VAELITGWLSDPAAIFSGVRKHDIRLGEDIEEGITVSLPSIEAPCSLRELPGR